MDCWDINSLSIAYCYGMISPPPTVPGDKVVHYTGNFSVWTKMTQMYLGVYPLAGIMVSGVIVHLLCISVILPSCEDRYIFYNDIHICM